MFKDIEEYLRVLPLFAVLAAVLGTLYNFCIVISFGADLIYTLSYADHINSAILAFGALVLISLLFELIVVVGFRAKSLFVLDLETGKLFLAFLALVASAISVYLIGGWNAKNLQAGLAFLLPFFSFVFLRRGVVDQDFIAITIAVLIMSTVAVWSGLEWVRTTKSGNGTIVIVTDHATFNAKGIKPFSNFAFVVDSESKGLVLRTAHIQRISR